MLDMLPALCEDVLERDEMKTTYTDRATLEGLRVVAHSDQDVEIRTRARQLLTDSDLARLDPHSVCAWCFADLGPAVTDSDSHAVCPACKAVWLADAREKVQ